MHYTNLPTSWDLSELYQSTTDPKIEADFTRADTLISQLETYRDQIKSLNPTKILELMKTWEEMGTVLHRIGLYAGLLESTNIGDATVTRFSKQIEERIIMLSQRIVFLDVEFSRLPEEKWQEILNATELKTYDKYFAKAYEAAKHTLSEPEEKILTEKYQTSWQALNHIYSLTTDTLTAEWDGKTITFEELNALFSSPDPEVRKKAAITRSELLKTNTKTTPAIYNALIQDKTISDRLRHHPYAEHARFMSDDVDKETVEAMVTKVTASHHLIDRYFAIKKKLLGTDTLYWWDRFAPLPDTETKIPRDQGTEMVIDSFSNFSPEVGEIVKTILEKKHIDWLPSPKKRGGAFCMFGEHGGYPYILLNYTDQPRDVMTLAHELGHGIHDVYAQKHNVVFQTWPSLAVAEIASVFSESLLFERLLQSDITKKDKIALLMGFIEDTFATVYRQVTMFQFEQAMHKTRREEGELSQEQIDDLWHTIMKKPFENSLIYTDDHKNSWMYVHHVFASPFYVYSYAFAQLCVLALYNQYKKDGEKFVPTYIQLLETGGAKSPKDTLALAGHDISKPDFWQGGIDIIEAYIQQLKELAQD